MKRCFILTRPMNINIRQLAPNNNAVERLAGAINAQVTATGIMMGNYTFYSRVAQYIFIFSLPLLFYTLFFGVKMNEGSRWIRLPFINMTMQTSDLARLALFMYLARLLSKKQDVIKDWKKGFVPVMIPVAITCLLIAPANLSTA